MDWYWSMACYELGHTAGGEWLAGKLAKSKPPPSFTFHGKIVFHKICRWCQKRLGTAALVYWDPNAVNHFILGINHFILGKSKQRKGTRITFSVVLKANFNDNLGQNIIKIVTFQYFQLFSVIKNKLSRCFLAGPVHGWCDIPGLALSFHNIFLDWLHGWQCRA